MILVFLLQIEDQRSERVRFIILCILVCNPVSCKIYKAIFTLVMVFDNKNGIRISEALFEIQFPLRQLDFIYNVMTGRNTQSVWSVILFMK